MIVKDKVGRRRYIAFIVESEIKISKEEINNAIIKNLRKNGEKIYLVKPRLIWFEDNKGILRCSHLKKQETIDAINSINNNIKARTLKTSGTIKGVKKSFFLSDGRKKKLRKKERP